MKNVTRISIQGRPHHSDYVSEFSISYGYNGLDYADFKEPGGNTKVKEYSTVYIHMECVIGKGNVEEATNSSNFSFFVTTN